MEILNTSCLVEIASYLPLKTSFDLLLVCKSWYTKWRGSNEEVWTQISKWFAGPRLILTTHTSSRRSRRHATDYRRIITNYLTTRRLALYQAHTQVMNNCIELFHRCVV